MTRMKTAAIAVLLLAAVSLQASTRYLFTISKSGPACNHEICQFTSVPPSPRDPVLVGYGCAVGTNVAVFGGHAYSIDVIHHPVRITVDGVSGPEIMWGANNVGVTTHYGWVIMNGQGWLASQYNDGDPHNYLFRVNISTGEAVFVDFIDGPLSGNPTFSITGMTAEPYFP